MLATRIARKALKAHDSFCHDLHNPVHLDEKEMASVLAERLGHDERFRDTADLFGEGGGRQETLGYKGLCQQDG